MVDADRTLLLIPTAGERRGLLSHLDKTQLRSQSWQIELCGFGLVAAAASTMHWLHQHQPDRVVLAGIAGSLHPDAAVGSASWFNDVVCDGIGVGEGASFQSASQLGWPQIAADNQNQSQAVTDRLSLCVPSRQTSSDDRSPHPNARRTLLSVCAASADPAMAQRRRDMLTPTIESQIHAEDMEAFGVALACQLHQTPCMVVRGISNQAGDRDHANWQIDPALAAAAKRICEAFKLT